MSHRRFQRLKEAYKEAYDESQQALLFTESFKDWVSVTTVVNIVLFAFGIVLLTMVHNSTVQAIVFLLFALSVFFVLVTVHEFLHGAVAKYYGYGYKFETSTLFIIPGINRPYQNIHITVTHPVNDKWQKDKTVIAIVPNLVMLLLGTTFCCIGLLWDILFFEMLGVLTIVGHLIAVALDLRVT